MKVAIIGGGPAGMLAAAEAARCGHAVTLFEQNEKLGKKLFITGKGRCNLTNTAEKDAFFEHIEKNARFLYSAFAAFDNRDIMALIEAEQVPLKTERGGRVFPVSDKSSDVLRAITRYLDKSGAKVRLNSRVSAVRTAEGRVTGIRSDGGDEDFDAVVVATGGLSYPSTGSTGDGYRFCEALGIRLVPRTGALVPLETTETWPYALAGLTLKNVVLSASRNGKPVFSELGEMLLTHFGVSGPLVLTLSSHIAEAPENVRLSIDLKPGLTREQLDKRLLRDLNENAKKQVGTAFSGLLPARLLCVVFSLAGIDPACMVGEFTQKQRLGLLAMLKALPLTVRRARPAEEAIVTRGGVDVREIDASTMRSKRIEGLYFAGEIIDTDALTGGFNLQIAWSTGALCGRSIGC